MAYQAPAVERGLTQPQHLPALLSIPDVDFYPLADAMGAFSDGYQYWWPCQASVTLMMNGSQNREYTINLADPGQPSNSNPGFCASVIDNPASGADSWYSLDFIPSRSICADIILVQTTGSWQQVFCPSTTSS